MKHRILSLLLVLTMGMSLLVGCGGSDAADDGAAQGNEEVVQQEEIDTSIYSERVTLTTEAGKTVQVYYDPTVIDYMDFEDSWFMLGNMRAFDVRDAQSAQAFMDAYLEKEVYLEISEQEEITLGGYTVHCYKLIETESGSFIGRYGVVELGSGVVFDFAYMDELSEETDGEVLAAIKFVVE